MKMRFSAMVFLAIVLMASLGGYVNAGPLQIEKLPRATKWLLHVDVARLRTSQFGRGAQALLVEKGLEKKLAAAEALFGVHPIKNIESITAAGIDGREENNVFYVDGSFDRKRLQTIMEAMDGYAAVSQGGMTIHRWPAKGKGSQRMVHVVFMSDSKAILALKEERLLAAVNVFEGKDLGLEKTSAWLPEAVDLKSLMIFASAQGINQMAGIKPQAPAFNHVTDAMLHLREDGGVLKLFATMNTDDAESARQIGDMARGLVAYGLLAGADKPKIAELARQARVVNEGNKIDFSFACDSARLLEIAGEGMARAKAAKVADQAEKKGGGEGSE